MVLQKRMYPKSQILGVKLTLHFDGCVEGLDLLVLVLMCPHDMHGDLAVGDLLAVITHHEKEVESRHNWRRNIQVCLERLALVVSPHDGVRRCQDRGPGVQGGLNSGLCDRNGLLFHRFVDCRLVLFVHLVELIDAADSVIGQHECSCLNSELSGVWISPYGGCETCR